MLFTLVNEGAFFIAEPASRIYQFVKVVTINVVILTIEKLSGFSGDILALGLGHCSVLSFGVPS
jgi:hypothetical protein